MMMSLPPPTVTQGENGLRIITEYKYNDEGQKVKVTRTVKMTLAKLKAQHAVVERKKWGKFGEAAKTARDGTLEEATPAVGEEVKLRLAYPTMSGQSADAEGEEQPGAREQAKKLQASKISCRICQGDHWTTKCPYKDTFQPGQIPSSSGTPAPATPSSASTGAEKYVPPKPGKYVPPSLRGGESRGPSASFSAGPDRSSDEPSTTVRVSNLSEDAQEADLQRLFGRFGPIQRMFIARHRDTGVAKGYAFVTYRSRSDAERALEMMHGYGFDSLILQVEWARN